MDTGPTTPIARKTPKNSKGKSTTGQQQRKKPGPKSSPMAPQQKKAPKASQSSPNNGLTKKSLASSQASPTRQKSSPGTFESPITSSKRKVMNEDISLPNSSPTNGSGAGTPFTPLLPPTKKLRTIPDDELQLALNMNSSPYAMSNFTLSMPPGHGSPTTQSYHLPQFNPATPSQSQPQPQRQLQPPFNPLMATHHSPSSRIPRPEIVQQQQQQQQPAPNPPSQQPHQQRNLLAIHHKILLLLNLAMRADPTLIPSDPTNASTPINSVHIDAIAHAVWQIAFKNEQMLEIVSQYAGMYSQVKLSALAKLNYLPSWWFFRESAVSYLTGKDGQARRLKVDDSVMNGLWHATLAWAAKVVGKGNGIVVGGGSVNGNSRGAEGERQAEG